MHKLRTWIADALYRLADWIRPKDPLLIAFIDSMSKAMAETFVYGNDGRDPREW